MCPPCVEWTDSGCLPEMLRRRSGIIRCYLQEGPADQGLKKSYEDLGLEVLLCRRCGNVAPNVSRWAFDMQKICDQIREETKIRK